MLSSTPRCSGSVKRFDAFLLLALVLFAYALSGKTCAAPVSRVLSNGLTVVASPESGSGRVAAVLMVRTGGEGTSPETLTQNQLLARLLMRDSVHRAPGRFDNASVDGMTWSEAETDVTTFSVVTVPDQMPASLRLLNLVLEPPPWDSSAVRSAVKREAAFGRQSVPIGWDADFLAWQQRAGVPVPPNEHPSDPDLSTLRDLHARLYVPNRMVLAVVGDVEASLVFSEAGRVFRKLSPRISPRIPMAAPEKIADTGMPYPATGTYAFAGYAAPAVTHLDAPALEVVAASLGRGKTSILFQRLRREAGTGYESGVVYPRRLGPSGVALFSRAPGSASRVAQELAAYWTEGREAPPGGWDLARAAAAHAYESQHQTARDRAYWLAFWETAGEGASFDRKYTARLRSVTDEAISEAIRTWINGPPKTLP